MIWEKGTVLPTFGELIGDYTTDVLVIGGGMAGLLCAWMLKEAGADCVVAEAGRICGGVTRGTSAKITVQHGLLYHKIAADRGWKCAADYLRANKLALEEFARLCGGMDCGFQRQNSYVYTMEDRKLLDEELCALERLRCPAELELKPDLPFQTAGACAFLTRPNSTPCVSRHASPRSCVFSRGRRCGSWRAVPPKPTAGPSGPNGWCSAVISPLWIGGVPIL